MNAHNLTPYDEITRLLRERLGFEPNSCGSRAVEQAVAARQKARCCHRVDAYLALLLAEFNEFQALVEELVVPETWFFRDAQPFLCLRQFARQQGLQTSGRPLRVLSIPCSTGEETYSQAIVLFDLGLRRSQCLVDGVDISQRSLDRAARGVYDAHSFREREDEWRELRDCYVRRQDAGWRVIDEIRELVRFRRANLVEPLFLPDEAPYDIIFCRNLFIYLDQEGRNRALAHLRRLLLPDGLLYVGHSEGSVLAGSDFITSDSEFPFAFRLRANGDAAKPVVPAFRDKEPVLTAPNTARRDPASGPTLPPPRRNRDSSPTHAATSSESLLNAAYAAANAGRFDDAIRACDDWLVRNQPAAAVFGLRGVVRKAQGRLDDAVRDLERAIYLDPLDEQSLVHLMQVHELRGERQRAETVRRRLTRVAHRREQTGAPP